MIQLRKKDVKIGWMHFYFFLAKKIKFDSLVKIYNRPVYDLPSMIYSLPV